MPQGTHTLPAPRTTDGMPRSHDTAPVLPVDFVLRSDELDVGTEAPPTPRSLGPSADESSQPSSPGRAMPSYSGVPFRSFGPQQDLKGAKDLDETEGDFFVEQEKDEVDELLRRWTTPDVLERIQAMTSAKL